MNRKEPHCVNITEWLELVINLTCDIPQTAPHDRSRNVNVIFSPEQTQEGLVLHWLNVVVTELRLKCGRTVREFVHAVCS